MEIERHEDASDPLSRCIMLSNKKDWSLSNAVADSLERPMFWPLF